MEDLVVYRVTAFSEALAEAFARLLPQLSPRLGALSEERLRRLLAAPAAALYVAERAGRIVGTLTLAWYDAPSGRKAWIEDVVVDTAYRGRGFGRMLVEHAVEYARQWAPVTLMLTSRPSRTEANALYRTAGFGLKTTNVYRMDITEK